MPSYSTKKALVEAIDQQLSETDLTVAHLARKLYCSERQVYRLVQEAFDLRPMELVRELRLRRARRLIAGGEAATVAGLAAAVGYAHPDHFSRLYALRFGERPSRHIKYGFERQVAP